MSKVDEMQNLVNNIIENLTVIENNEEFIPIYETDKGEKVVNGRELYEGLGVQKQFTDWIENSLNSVDATKNDFFTLKGKSTGGRPSVEYILKLEIAKEICLVAGASPRANDLLRQKSKAYRKYLIQFEEKYKNPLQGMSKELQAILLVDKKQQANEKRITEVAEDLKDFKENAPLFNVECDELQKALKKKLVHLLGGKQSPAYRDNSIRQKAFIDAQHQIKREFAVSSYKGIKRVHFEKALEIIENYTLPTALQEVVTALNSQVSIQAMMIEKDNLIRGAFGK